MMCTGLTFHHPRPSSFTLGPIDLEGPDDRPWLILGRSGAGKSTFLRLLSGSIRPAGGTMIGVPPRGEVAYLPQLPERALAGRNLAEDLCGEVRPAPAVRSALRSALREAGLAGVPLSRRSRDLSLGERRRLALALLLRVHRRGWALDEPDAGLDLSGRQGLIDVLGSHPAGPGAPRWIAASRFDIYAPLHPWVVVLEGGRVAARGELPDLIRTPEGRELLGGRGWAAFRIWEGISGGAPQGSEGSTEGGRVGQVQELIQDRMGFR
jgi:ABC-type multidrug transport system ATPase subunit